tara:strand:+ start:5821 stop:6207 length:387 start_codon:yes stop_codon:yes gene_type:complete
MAKVPPTCWKCGYELSGLKVDDLCPECGCAVWSRPPIEQATQNASRSMTWGIVSLVLFFACLGPLAGLLAIPAVTYASKANTEVRQGLIDKSQISGAKTGLILGWITIGLSLLAVCAYAFVLVLTQYL